MRAHEPVVVVGQESVRREVQGASLVRAEVEPGAGTAVSTGNDQPHRLTVLLELEFTILPFGQLVGGAEEHWFIHGV